MKKILTLIVALVATATVAHAQFGIVGGLNFSKTDIKVSSFIEEAKNVTLYHAGVAWKMKLPLGVAIQPELTYQVRAPSWSSSRVKNSSTRTVTLNWVPVSSGVRTSSLPVLTCLPSLSSATW